MYRGTLFLTIVVLPIVKNNKIKKTKVLLCSMFSVIVSNNVNTVRFGLINPPPIAGSVVHE